VSHAVRTLDSAVVAAAAPDVITSLLTGWRAGVCGLLAGGAAVKATAMLVALSSPAAPAATVAPGGLGGFEMGAAVMAALPLLASLMRVALGLLRGVCARGPGLPRVQERRSQESIGAGAVL
jgi:hypothetical protein